MQAAACDVAGPVNMTAMTGSALGSREEVSADPWNAPRFFTAMLLTACFIGVPALLTGNALLLGCLAVLMYVELFAYLAVGHLRTRGLSDREMLALPWIVLSGPRQRERLSRILADRQMLDPPVTEP